MSGPALLLPPPYIMHYCHCCGLFLLTLPLSFSSHSNKSCTPGCLRVRSIKSLRINSPAIQLCMHDTRSNDAIQSRAHTYCLPMAALVPELLFLVINCSPECYCLGLKQVHKMKCHGLTSCFSLYEKDRRCEGSETLQGSLSVIRRGGHGPDRLMA